MAAAYERRPLVCVYVLVCVGQISGTYSLVLLQLGQHDDDRDALLPNHMPEVIAGARQGTLTGDVSLLSARLDRSIHIRARIVFHSMKMNPSIDQAIDPSHTPQYARNTLQSISVDRTSA